MKGRKKRKKAVWTQEGRISTRRSYRRTEMGVKETAVSVCGKRIEAGTPRSANS